MLEPANRTAVFSAISSSIGGSFAAVARFFISIMAAPCTVRCGPPATHCDDRDNSTGCYSRRMRGKEVRDKTDWLPCIPERFDSLRPRRAAPLAHVRTWVLSGSKSWGATSLSYARAGQTRCICSFGALRLSVVAQCVQNSVHKISRGQNLRWTNRSDWSCAPGLPTMNSLRHPFLPPTSC